jgi:hypothetical protein
MGRDFGEGLLGQEDRLRMISARDKRTDVGKKIHNRERVFFSFPQLIDSTKRTFPIYIPISLSTDVGAQLSWDSIMLDIKFQCILKK